MKIPLLVHYFFKHSIVSSVTHINSNNWKSTYGFTNADAISKEENLNAAFALLFSFLLAILGSFHSKKVLIIIRDIKFYENCFTLPLHPYIGVKILQKT